MTDCGSRDGKDAAHSRVGMAYCELAAGHTEPCKACDECQNADITGPGKFQGEPIETFHAYHVMIDGHAGDTNGPYWRVGSTICHERDDGFVESSHFDTDDEAILNWKVFVEARCFSDDCTEQHNLDGEHLADEERKPCDERSDAFGQCLEYAQANKRYCTYHLAQIQKLADAGRLP